MVVVFRNCLLVTCVFLLLPNNQASPQLLRLAGDKQAVINAPAAMVGKMDGPVVEKHLKVNKEITNSATAVLLPPIVALHSAPSTLGPQTPFSSFALTALVPPLFCPFSPPPPRANPSPVHLRLSQ